MVCRMLPLEKAWNNCLSHPVIMDHETWGFSSAAAYGMIVSAKEASSWTEAG